MTVDYFIGTRTVPGGRVAGVRLGRVWAAHVFGSRQVDLHAWRLSVAIGLPLEWPVWRRYPTRWRLGFGPFSVSWWDP